ncbi:MAG: hypothetical protein K6F21_07290 [Bacteroidales bacterium]|nr:hypothetical protein [Bacteroidales bacterium]
MKLKFYSKPEADIVISSFRDSILITSGYDKFHAGGGGYYGDTDLNDNEYVY